MGLPTGPGLYLVTCGSCLAHVGTSGNLARRVRTLANLGRHGGSNEILCAAFCTGQPPQVWWEACSSVAVARQREAAFKRHYGEPPAPGDAYAACSKGQRLRGKLVRAAGEGSWAAGYVEAIFDIPSGFWLLMGPRFEAVWRRIGKPPGPWAGTTDT
jgi:hypothetical protein